nr:VQ-motif-containing protein 11 [Paeonia ostii]
MASTTTDTTTIPISQPSIISGCYDPASSPNTTYVQADPSTFRAVVQKLTGAPEDPSTQKLPVSHSSRLTNKLPTAGEIGPRKPAFKLHERRQSVKKLEINLNHGGGGGSSSITSPSYARSFVGFGGEMVLVSPVSHFDLFCRGSPRTPKEEEEKAIAEKGFYLHPNPLSTPRGSEPELLPLFPVRSPRDHNDSSSS